MTLANAIEQLDALPFAYICGRGRSRPDEPLYGLALFEDRDGVASDEPCFKTEGDSLSDCVIRATAWAAEQKVAP